MSRSALAVGVGITMAWIGVPSARADGLLYAYECDVLPYDPSAGWVIFNPCDMVCSEAIENGRLVFRWPQANDHVIYDRTIALTTDTQPRSLWVEWRLRSNHPIPRVPFGCDARFVVQYRSVDNYLYIYGDAVFDSSESGSRSGLELNQFHTFRFESRDGVHYRFAVDGDVFLSSVGLGPVPNSFVQFAGDGGCLPDQIPNMVNEWDYVRFGTIGFGEKMIASDPPSGFIDLRHQAPPDRFAVTFDHPNYVYIENITVEVTGVGTKPVVTATWRRDQDGPETLEVVLDRPIPANATTRFILNDGEIINTVRYTTKLGDTDGDGDTDLAELAALQNCFHRPTPDAACGALDLSDNALIDLPDLPQLLDPLLTGPK